MRITILLDTSDSFLLPYIEVLIQEFEKRGHTILFLTDHKQLKQGDVLYLLACKTILSKELLSLHKHNLVIHPSKLPEGRGSAALVWKILDGKNKIFISLFEANEYLDKGDIYFQESIEFEGYELCDEIRRKQAIKTHELALKFIDNIDNVHPIKQEGKRSYYKKRKLKDSEIDINKTIKEQFNLLRVVDNERYPAFFIKDKHKYKLKIFYDGVIDEN